MENDLVEKLIQTGIVKQHPLMPKGYYEYSQVLIFTDLSMKEYCMLVYLYPIPQKFKLVCTTESLNKDHKYEISLQDVLNKASPEMRTKIIFNLNIFDQHYAGK